MKADRQLVVVARVLLPAGLERIRERFEIREGGLDATREDLLSMVGGASAVVPDPSVSIDAHVLAVAGDQLKVIANFAVGYDNIDLDACRDRGIVVTNTPDVLTEATPELAMALTFAAARRMSDAERDLGAGGGRGRAHCADAGGGGGGLRPPISASRSRAPRWASSASAGSAPATRSSLAGSAQRFSTRASRRSPRPRGSWAPRGGISVSCSRPQTW